MSQSEKNFDAAGAMSDFDIAARQLLGSLACGFAIFVTGCIVYTAGGSVLWAWGGTIIFLALAVAAAVLGALTAREAARELAVAVAESRAAASPSQVTLQLSRPSAERLEQHLARHFGDGRLVEEIREALLAPPATSPAGEVEVPPPLIRLDASAMLDVIAAHGDLIDLNKGEHGEAVMEWAEARHIDSKGLFDVGDLIAASWARTLDLHLEGDRLCGFQASYAMAVSIGVEIERSRRDRMELPR